MYPATIIFFLIFAIPLICLGVNKNSSPQWTQWCPSFPVGQNMSEGLHDFKMLLLPDPRNEKTLVQESWNRHLETYKKQLESLLPPIRNKGQVQGGSIPCIPAVLTQWGWDPTGWAASWQPLSSPRAASASAAAPYTGSGTASSGRESTATPSTWIRPPKPLNCAKYHSIEILFQYNNNNKIFKSLISLTFQFLGFYLLLDKFSSFFSVYITP